MRTCCHRLLNPNQFWVEVFFSGPGGPLQSNSVFKRGCSVNGPTPGKEMGTCSSSNGTRRAIESWAGLGAHRLDSSPQGCICVLEQNAKAQPLFGLISNNLLEFMGKALTYQLTKLEIIYIMSKSYTIHCRAQKQSNWDTIVSESSTNQFTL